MAACAFLDLPASVRHEAGTPSIRLPPNDLPTVVLKKQPEGWKLRGVDTQWLAGRGIFAGNGRHA
jgi:hypothetical protein